METYHILKIETDGTEQEFSTLSFAEYLQERSNQLVNLEEGEDLHCWQSNDEYAQFGCNIFGHDGQLFEHVSKGQKTYKRRAHLNYIINDEDWLENQYSEAS